jgi:hypothetical protein
MSKVMRFDYYCDNRDAHKANTVPADTVLVYSPKQEQVVELEACDDCLGLGFNSVTDLADRYGREIKPETDPALACPIADCSRNKKPFKDKGGLTRHLTRIHPEYDQGSE